MSLDLLVVIFSLFGTLFLGLFTLSKNQKSITNILFFLFTLTIALYITVNYFSLHQSSIDTTLFLIRGTMAIAVWINLLYFLLVSAFPNSKIQIKPWILIASVLSTVLLAAGAFTQLIFSGIAINHGNISPTPNVGMVVFLLHTVIFIGGGFITLINKFRHSAGVAKNQIRLFLSGTVIMFLSILISNVLIVLLFKTSAFIGLLPVYTLIFVGCISYAIIKHGFLDIGFLVTRTVIYFILIFAVAGIWSALIFYIGHTLLGIVLSPVQSLFFVLSSVIIALSFHPLQRRIESFTSRWLFKSHYDTDSVLQRVSKIMAFTLRLDDMTRGIFEQLSTSLHMTKAAFILFEDGKIADVRNIGFASPPSFDEGEIKQVSQTRDTIIFDELDEGPTKDILRKLNFTVIAHLRTEGKLIGLLALGAKSSGDIYSRQDLALINILASETAIGIQNTLSYEKIRRFNITLQEEVNKATADLKTANQQLELLDKLKDEFVSVASHELRTPMTAIKSYSWMVLNGKAGAITPKATEYLNRVYISTERLIHLINEMLDVSRIESGRVTIKKVPLDVGKLFADVQTELQGRAAETQINLKVTTEDAIPMVQADPEKIHQVLENLVGNSLKFTPANGSITMGARAKDGFLEISVTDTGSGIRPEEIPLLFTKFGRLENSLVAMPGNSTGLGLYISKQYVELHGGKIRVTSAPRKGSTFTFTLPI